MEDVFIFYIVLSSRIDFPHHGITLIFSVLKT